MNIQFPTLNIQHPR